MRGYKISNNLAGRISPIFCLTLILITQSISGREREQTCSPANSDSTYCAQKLCETKGGLLPTIDVLAFGHEYFNVQQWLVYPDKKLTKDDEEILRSDGFNLIAPKKENLFWYRAPDSFTFEAQFSTRFPEEVNLIRSASVTKNGGLTYFMRSNGAIVSLLDSTPSTVVCWKGGEFYLPLDDLPPVEEDVEVVNISPSPGPVHESRAPRARRKRPVASNPKGDRPEDPAIPQSSQARSSTSIPKISPSSDPVPIAGYLPTPMHHLGYGLLSFLDPLLPVDLIGKLEEVVPTEECKSELCISDIVANFSVTKKGERNVLVWTANLKSNTYPARKFPTGKIYVPLFEKSSPSDQWEVSSRSALIAQTGPYRVYSRIVDRSSPFGIGPAVLKLQIKVFSGLTPTGEWHQHEIEIIRVR